MDLGNLLRRSRDLPLILAIVILTLLLGGYMLLFSNAGNRLLAPYAASKLSKRLGFPVLIDTFVLTPTHYTLRFHDQDHNHFTLDGTYSLGTLKTKGTLGALGASAEYTVGFQSFSIDSLQLRFRHLAIAPLLHKLDYPSKSIAYLHGEIHLSGLAQRKIKGTIQIESQTTAFIPSPIKDEDSNISLDLYDLLAEEDGSVKPFSIECSTDITLDEIGIIEQLIGYPVRGKAALKTHIHGNQESLIFDFNTPIAKSNSQIQVVYKALLPHQIRYTLSHANIESLFHLFNAPSPISGIIDSTGMINPQSGTLQFTLRDGRTKPTVLKQAYGITQPNVRFNMQVSAHITKNNTITYQAFLQSDLGRIASEHTTSHTQMLAELLKTIP